MKLLKKLSLPCFVFLLLFFAFSIKPSHAQATTFVMAFVDSNSNGVREAGEPCYTPSFKLSIDAGNGSGVFKSFQTNCILNPSNVTSTNSINITGPTIVTFIVPSGYQATKNTAYTAGVSNGQVFSGNNIHVDSTFQALEFGIKPVIGGNGSGAGTSCKEKPSLTLVNQVKDPDSNIYILKLVNNNPSNCSASKFNHEIPAGQLSGWNISFFPSGNLSVAPNVPATFTVTVKPPSNAAKKTYDFSVSSADVNVVSPKADKVSLSYALGNGGGNGNGSGNPTCTKKADVTVVSPSNTSGKVGDQISYTIKVSNNDSGKGCNSSDDFTLTNAMGNHLTGSFDQSILKNIAAGQSKTTTLKVKAKSGSGAQTFTVYADGANNPKVSDRGQFTIKTSGGGGNPKDTQVPTAVPTQGGGHGGGNGIISMSLGIDGLGTTPKISIGGNTTPQNPNRNITIKLYDSKSNSFTEGWDSWTFSYNPSTKKFDSQLALSDGFPTGVYNVYALGLPYVNARIPGSVTITKGQTNRINNDNFYMTTGNINDSDQSENKVDILDYNVLISCWIYSQNQSACNQDAKYHDNSDLNGDGQVDQDDYTLFLKEFGAQGAILPDQ